MEHELRRYRIRAGFMDVFLDAWLAQVPPLRREFGFRIIGAWVAEAEGEFVWILGYDGPDGFDAADARYYASNARATLQPDPAQWIAKADHVRVRPVPSTP